jgi:hypothetical protein
VILLEVRTGARRRHRVHLVIVVVVEGAPLHRPARSKLPSPCHAASSNACCDRRRARGACTDRGDVAAGAGRPHARLSSLNRSSCQASPEGLSRISRSPSVKGQPDPYTKSEPTGRFELPASGLRIGGDWVFGGRFVFAGIAG